MAQATHHVWCRPRSYLQAVGGCVVDSGKFDWMKRDPTGTRFPSMTAPEPAYHGLVFAEQFGDLAFTIFGHAVGLRDLGCTMAPQNAFYSLLGVETLSLRMERHCANALALAEYVSLLRCVPESACACVCTRGIVCEVCGRARSRFPCAILFPLVKYFTEDG